MESHFLICLSPHVQTFFAISYSLKVFCLSHCRIWQVFPKGRSPVFGFSPASFCRAPNSSVPPLMADGELMLFIFSTTAPASSKHTLSFTPVCPFWTVPSTSSNTLLQTAVITGQMLCCSLHTFPLKSLNHLAIEFNLVLLITQVFYLLKMPWKCSFEHLFHLMYLYILKPEYYLLTPEME